MSVNLLSNLGLTASLLDTFGFTGNVAAQTFGNQAFTSFVEATLQQSGALAATSTLPLTFDFNGLLDLASRSDAVAGTTGLDNGALNQLLAVDQQLQAQTGAGLDDIVITTDANGNITGTLTGVEGATNTININDIIAQAFDVA